MSQMMKQRTKDVKSQVQGQTARTEPKSGDSQSLLGERWGEGEQGGHLAVRC